MDLSGRIRALLACGIEHCGTQMALADRLKMKQATLQRLLTGKSLKMRSSSYMRLRNDLIGLARAVLPQVLMRSIGGARLTPQELASKAKLPGKKVDDFISARSYPSKAEFDAMLAALGENLLSIPHESELEPDCSALERKPMEHLSMIRAKAGLTQSQLAAISGVSQRAISSYESGTRSPKQGHLKSIAQSLSVKPSSLLEGLELGEWPSPGKVATRRLKSLKSLPEDAKELLDAFMALNPMERKQVMSLVRELSGTQD